MLLALLLACAAVEAPALLTYTEDRQPCADRTPLRRPLYGDLHVHGAFSFDARNYGSLVEPSAVLAFARGEPVDLPDGAGGWTRTVQLDRPLDFVAATEHGDLLGEVAHCTTPGAQGYDSDLCAAYQGGDPDGALDFGVMLASEEPTRSAELCGEDGTGCQEAARGRWSAMQQATEDAYDRSSDCAFTTFVGYEYTNTYAVSNLHRNVIFRTATVPGLPVSVFEAPTPADLWRQLDQACPGGGTVDDPACDVLVIPHNSNLSNGRLFTPDYGVDATEAEEQELAALRARMEPLVEVFQHKGDSECRDGLGQMDDPACTFEKLRDADDEVCEDDEVGTGGMRLWGCEHRLDYVREVLGEGLVEGARLGRNPYRLGMIGSTDTHNGTPGLVRSVDFPGHVGVVDATAEARLTGGNVTHDTLINNPGGLAGVWSVENSRDAIWEALQRRETFATSGPRIAIRLFAGQGLATDLCAQPEPALGASLAGVPMGSAVPPGQGPMRILVQATADEGSSTYPGVGLASLEIVKVWLDADGQPRQQVVTVATGEAGSLDEQTCAAAGGAASLCAVWEDPDFDPSLPALWYARALEVPTCRWSQRECLSLPAKERPAACTDGSVPATVQQRAWSSPAWWELSP